MWKNRRADRILIKCIAPTHATCHPNRVAILIAIVYMPSHMIRGIVRHPAPAAHLQQPCTHSRPKIKPKYLTCKPSAKLAIQAWGRIPEERYMEPLATEGRLPRKVLQHDGGTHLIQLISPTRSSKQASAGLIAAAAAAAPGSSAG